jgi:Raf kinase inhibitor-like YbhB/YbcL family protein
MKSRWIAVSAVCALAAAAFAESGPFRLASTEWHDGDAVPMRNVFNESGCDGENFSPEFHWSGVPQGAKSLAFTIFDLDAPALGGWWHWVVFNIPVTAGGLPDGAGDKHAGRLPPGSVQCRNDYGEPGYGGPCPPPGTTHRYVAKVYALDVEKLSLGADPSSGSASRQIAAHSIATAELTVRFGR